MTPSEFRQARIALGLSQQQMAVWLGVHSGRVIRRWESGGTAIPGPVIVALRYALQHGVTGRADHASGSAA